MSCLLFLWPVFLSRVLNVSSCHVTYCTVLRKDRYIPRQNFTYPRWYDSYLVFSGSQFWQYAYETGVLHQARNPMYENRWTQLRNIITYYLAEPPMPTATTQVSPLGMQCVTETLLNPWMFEFEFERFIGTQLVHGIQIDLRPMRTCQDINNIK